ncbi:MAG: hypothetical protein JXA78_18185 [Anaerolineales bacterium]|nr:hypothetical protein [Anaerolineales bacterium]
MQAAIKRLTQRDRLAIWMVPVALLVLCALSFGVMASKLGFYWDDWFITWYIHFLGPSIFKEAFAIDRPLQGWLYVLTTGLVGESPLLWQFFGIFARWLGCLALWWMLRGLWPRKIVQTTIVAFLFAVYPGFSQQHIAITTSHQLLALATTLFSLGALNWALRKPRCFWPLYVLSIASSGLGLFVIEYFFGLELLRPVFIWLTLSETITGVRQRLKRLGLYWAPYLILMILFLVWRISTPTPRGQVNVFARLGADPSGTALELAATIFGDVIKASLLAWGKVFDGVGLLAYGPGVILRFALIVLGTAVFVALYLAFLYANHRFQEPDVEIGRRRWAIGSILLGLYALLIAGVPFWTTGLRISLSFTRDRFTQPMMIGASLLLAGLIELVPRFRIARFILVGLAVGLAAGLHFQTTLNYYQEWLLQKDFFWQLAWRAPGIEPGTAVLISDVPFVYDWDNSLTAPLNWIYAPQLSGRELPYQIYNVESHLTRGLPGFMDGARIRQRNRLTLFDGSTSQAISVFYRPPACLLVVDPLRDQRLPDKPRYFRELLPFSRPDLILPDANPPATLPVDIFGPEPEHDWCYYFQKAELARQAGDWEQTAALADQALEGGRKIYRRNAFELLPFIEGYARVGRWQRAVELSLEAYQAWENMRLALCDTWMPIRQSTELDAEGQAAYERIESELQCAAP